MRLVSAEISGFRRFWQPQKLYLDRPLVCLVGANETGKSSALEALEMATQSDEEIAGVDRSRGRGIPDDHVVARLEFRLDREDRRAIRELGLRGEASEIRKFTLLKLANGQRQGELDSELHRDTRARGPVVTALGKAVESETWPNEAEFPDTPVTADRVADLQNELADADEDLPPQAIDEMRNLASLLEQAEVQPALVTSLQELAEGESLQHPHREAILRLLGRVPTFVSFDDEARTLEAEYDLATVAADPPPALANLAALAGLDLGRLSAVVAAGESGTAQTLKNDANEVLHREFKAWTQEPEITVAFEHTDEVLRVHVKSGEGDFMKIDERSDGLKQFVALVALVKGPRDGIKPILLIDEAERHLHYDAQADLMDVLSRQLAAEQVIYSTHSPACLPEDLGSSVRVVEGIEDRTESQIRNSFWTDEPGMGPMLLAMGAGSLVFVPLRPAMIVEGGSDLVLLGTLIGETTRSERLSYQIVPGSSNMRPTQIAGLDLQGTETVWVFDGDENGRDRRNQLLEHDIPEQRIFLWEDADGNGLDLEDLIHPDAYVDAVTSYAADLRSEATFTHDDLPDETLARHARVEIWCEANRLKPPSKTAIANKVLDLREQERPLLDPERREVVSALHQAVKRLLG